MSKEQLLHIFDKSACLTRKQMKEYAEGSMTNEEVHAIEVHLCACPLCSESAEGFQKNTDRFVLSNMLAMNGEFLKDHLSLQNPQVHLNSMAATAPPQHVYKRRRRLKVKTQPLWRMSSLGAMLLIGCSILWYMKYGKKPIENSAQTVAVQQAKADETNTDKSTPIPNATSVTTATQVNESARPLPVETDVPTTTTAAPNNVTARTENGYIQQASVTNSQPSASNTQQSTPSPNTPENKSSFVAERNTSSEDRISTNQKADTAPVKKEAVIKQSSPKPAAATTEDNISKGDRLFEEGKYNAAAKTYNKEMDNDDKSLRQEAAVKSAQSYISSGNVARGTKILEDVVDEGGPEKRKAKKILRKLKKGEQ